MLYSPNPRILYVDDNHDSCEIVGVMLHLDDDSYAVTAVSTAEKAIRFMEDQLIDLYILDYALPEMSGVELCRYIRQYDADTPILFFSALAREKDIAEARAAGASDYLIKPDDLERLTETVRRFLSETPTTHKTEPVTVKAEF